MLKVLLAATVTTGLFTLTAPNVSAAPVSGLAAVHVAPDQGMVTNADWYWRHRHWHHRRWWHNQWRYW